MTLTCTVTPAAELTLTAPPMLELNMAGGIAPVFVQSGFTLSYTVQSVGATDAGVYYCRAYIQVEGLKEPLVARGFDHNLVVFSKFVKTFLLFNILTVLFRSSCSSQTNRCRIFQSSGPYKCQSWLDSCPQM